MPKTHRNWKLKKTTAALGIAAVFVILTAIFLPNQDVWLTRAATADQYVAVEGYWWAPNVGWLKMQWGNDEQSVRIYKGSMSHPAIFTGYAWGPNLGWVNLQPNPPTVGVYIRDNENLGDKGPWPVDGFAWSPNMGWINFDAIDQWDHQGTWPADHSQHKTQISADEPQIIRSGLSMPGSNPSEDAKMKGYAWSPNVGWIDLSRADIPGWQDNTQPTLEYFEVSPVGAGADSGFYQDKFAYYPSQLMHFDAGHFIWLKPDTAFDVKLHSLDKRVRDHDLNISNVIVSGTAIPNQYIWWDRLRFRPYQDPAYLGEVKHQDTLLNEFLSVNGFPTGEDPIPEEVSPGDPATQLRWKSVSRLLTGTPQDCEIGGNCRPADEVRPREFRYNVRDAGGNVACADGTFDWSAGKGCVIPTLGAPSPMSGRMGVAVDHLVPAATLALEGHPMDEHAIPPMHVSGEKDIYFTIVYSDLESGANHVKLEYRRKQGPLWPVNWVSPPIAERQYNVGRNDGAPVTWDVDGKPDPSHPDDVENPLDTSDPGMWPDGQEFQIRLTVTDNVGNTRERIFPAVIDRMPPATTFTAQDPVDLNANRTRYEKVKLWLPASAEYIWMSFSNNQDQWSAEESYPQAGDYRSREWDLNWPDMSGENVAGGEKTVYGKFCDNTWPTHQCVIVPTTIAAPWFQGAQGDIYAGEQAGNRNGTYQGVAPYQGARQQYNATYRITSAGEIKPQITTQQTGQGWREENYQDFDFPALHGSIASIDWDHLMSLADPKTESEIAAMKVIDFSQTAAGVIYLKPDLFGVSPDFTLRNAEGNDVIIKGRGTFLVDGSLRVSANMYYADELSQPVQQIDSLGVVIRRSNNSRLGNLYIDQQVSHVVGAYIVGYGDCKKCLDSLGSGVLHSSADFTAGIGRPQITTTGGELVLEGMVAARDFNLTRYSTGTQNFLNNASFEQMGGSKTCPDQWTCDGAGGATFGPSSSPPVVFGQRKLQIKVTPMATATLSQKVNLAGIGTTSSPQVSTSSLTASFYLRSLNITLTPAQVKVLINDAECTPLVPAKIDAQWRRFQCTIPNTATVVELKLVARGLRTGVGPYTLEVDGAQIELAAEATEWHDMFTATDTNYQASERFYYDGRVIFNTPLGFAPLSTPSWSETAAD